MKQILMAIGIGFVVYLMLAYVPGLLKRNEIVALHISVFVAYFVAFEYR